MFPLLNHGSNFAIPDRRLNDRRLESAAIFRYATLAVRVSQCLCGFCALTNISLDTREYSQNWEAGKEIKDERAPIRNPRRHPRAHAGHVPRLSASTTTSMAC